MHPFIRYSTLCVFALALSTSRVLAADCSGDLTITKTADLSTLSACPTYSGSVTIQSVFLDTTPVQVDGGTIGVSNPRIEVDGIKEIAGDLAFRNNAVSSGDDFGITFPSLKSVSDLEFSNMSALLMPEFYELQMAETITFDNINFTGHTAFGREQWPALEAVLLISVTNTTMTTLGDWDRPLVWIPSQEKLDITGIVTPFLAVTAIDNPLLNEISLTGYSNTSNGIIARLATNGDDLQVNFAEFDHASLWIQDTASFSATELSAVPVDSSVEQNMEKAGLLPDQTIPPGFTNNIFTSLGLPKLVNVGDQFMIKNNTYLSDLSLPSLKSVNSLAVANNPELKNINLPAMGDIQGSLSITGSFNSLKFPKLKDTAGDLHIDSTDGQFSCSGLDDRQKHQRFIKGTYSCSSDGTGLTTGAIAGISVGVVLAVVIVAVLVGLWWARRRRQAKHRAVEKTVDARDSESTQSGHMQENAELKGVELNELENRAPAPEMPNSERSELDSPSAPSELQTNQEISELPGGHHIPELPDQPKISS